MKLMVMPKIRLVVNRAVILVFSGSLPLVRRIRLLVMVKNGSIIVVVGRVLYRSPGVGFGVLVDGRIVRVVQRPSATGGGNVKFVNSFLLLGILAGLLKWPVRGVGQLPSKGCSSADRKYLPHSDRWHGQTINCKRVQSKTSNC